MLFIFQIFFFLSFWALFYVTRIALICGFFISLSEYTVEFYTLCIKILEFIFALASNDDCLGLCSKYHEYVGA